MSTFLKFLLEKFKFRKKDVCVTSLLLTENELQTAVKDYKNFKIIVDSAIKAADSQLLYRNLIRLTETFGIDKANITILIKGDGVRTAALRENFAHRGFERISIESPSKTACVNLATASPGQTGVLFKKFRIAGLGYRITENDTDNWRRLQQRCAIRLVAEPDNEYDGNAVAIYARRSAEKEKDIKLGYVPRTENSELAAIFRAGRADLLDAVITGVDMDAPVSERVWVSVYLRTRR